MLEEIKQADYDKFLAIGFAPAELKKPLAALFLYHAEIEKIPLEVSESMVGQIKIQWWREVLQEIIDGKVSRPHPILLALKDSGVDHSAMISILDKYDAVLEEKLPQQFDELKQFLLATEVKILEAAAKLLNAPFNADIALAYAFNRYGRKLAGKNDALSGKLLEESGKLLPPGNASVFGAITRFYNKKPASPRWKLAFSLIGGKHQLI